MHDKMRIAFFGTPDFAVPALYALHQSGYELAAVITQPDRPKGRGQKVSSPPVKEAALNLGLSVYQPVRIKEDSFIEMLTTISPDLIVVVAFGQILPKRILELPLLGCINVHASLLPAYRGAAPIHWAILNGEKETGITTMLMDSGLDTGDMLLRERVVILPEMTTGELHDLLAETGAKLLQKTIELWRQGQIRPESQERRVASYAPLLNREHELIHWGNTAEQINNQIRGLQPWPGAFTYYQGYPLKITKAGLYSPEGGRTAPGTVLEILKGQGFVVQTGQGSIIINCVQPNGKKIMPADSYVNGYHLEVGYVFGAS